MTDTASVCATGVVKRFGHALALDDVSLTVRAGEIVVLHGDNGAGKSTLLRVLAGMVVPDAGTAVVLGADTVKQRSTAVGRLGTMFDAQHSWYPRLTGRANLEFFAAARGAPRPAIRAAVARELERVALAEAADVLVAGYSTGMRARLGLARARALGSRALLLDEPTASLDRRSAEAFVEQLVDERDGVVVLVATHDDQIGDRLGARRVTLERGAIVS